MFETVQGVMMPFIGTSLGAACVFPMKKELCPSAGNVISGFAAGVMNAAAVWSLLLPSIESAGEAGMGRLSFLPAALGLMLGTVFMLLLGKAVRSIESCSSVKLPASTMSALAVTLHNIPEGMVVGAAYAGVKNGSGNITAAAAMALAAGIAVQNLPEGAMISLPLKAGGMSRARAFVIGVLSGAVEPLGALLTIYAAGHIAPAMPYLLSFAAGAMFYVSSEELIPNASECPCGLTACTAGFALMMSLDVMFG